MAAPVFGVIDQRFNDEPLPTAPLDFSAHAYVTTSTGADPSVFPHFVAVRFNSSDTATVKKLGTGFLADAVRGAADQVAPGQRAIDITVVRVPEGTNADAAAKLAETQANVVIGLNVLKGAPRLINKTPRLVGTPGYTVERPNGVNAVAVTAGGSGYTSAPTVAFAGGSGTGAAATAILTQGVGAITLGAGGTGYTSAPTVTLSAPDEADGVQATATASVSSGAVTGFTVTNKGRGYTAAPTVTITGAGTGATASATLTGIVKEIQVTAGGRSYASAPTVSLTGGAGSGAAASATVDQLANPIVAALPPVLNALLAIAVVDVDPSTMEAAVNARETMGSERIMPVGVAVKVSDPETGQIVVRPAASRVLGLFTRVDFQSGGKPFETIANRQIYGIVGTSRDIDFDLRDGATEGQQMLAAEVAIIVKGEVDVDGAIADGGFVFIGVDNCATDGDLWQQIHQVRGQDCIDVEHMRLTRKFLGPKISADTAEAWINSLKFNLRDHKADNDILGYKVEFKPDQNSPEEVRLGRLAVDLGIETAPAFRVAKRNVRRYRQAVVDLVADIAARINANALY